MIRLHHFAAMSFAAAHRRTQLGRTADVFCIRNINLAYLNNLGLINVKLISITVKNIGGSRVNKVRMSKGERVRGRSVVTIWH